MPPVLGKVLLLGSASCSAALTSAALPNGPSRSIEAVTVIVAPSPAARLAIVQGNSLQGSDTSLIFRDTLLIVRFVGRSSILMLVAFDGPALLTIIVY